MFKAIVLLFSALVFVITCSSLAQALVDKAWITVYSGFGYTGESVNISDLKDADLTSSRTTYPSGNSLKDNIKSVCGAGAWAFHQDTDFRGATELVKLKDGDCDNLKLATGRVSSLHKISIEHASSIILYFKANYDSGVEHDRDWPNSGDRNLLPHDSVIISGESSWTVFSKSNFSGRSTCLVPAIDEYLQVQGIPDLTVAPYSEIISPNDTIKSVRKGCRGDEDQVICVGTENRPSFFRAMAAVGFFSLIVAVMCMLGMFNYRKKLLQVFRHMDSNGQQGECRIHDAI